MIYNPMINIYMKSVFSLLMGAIYFYSFDTVFIMSYDIFEVYSAK